MIARSRMLIMALAAAALMIPAAAWAAKKPVAYQYGSHCKKNAGCVTYAITNPRQTKITSIYLNPKCKNSAGSIFFELPKAARISKKHKFSFTLNALSSDGSGPSIKGTVKVKGKLKKKKTITGKWSLDKASAGCANVDSGKIKFKYHGALYGG